MTDTPSRAALAAGKVLYTDIDPYCCEVLRARVADGSLPVGEVWERDIRTITPAELKAFTQIHLFAGIGGIPLGFAMAGWPHDSPVVTAGFPCQPVSVNGLQKAQADERWMWPQIARLLCELRWPRLLLENVSGLLDGSPMHEILGYLASIGYDAEWDCVPAAALGAPHLRERVFLVAYPAGAGPQGQEPTGGVWGRGLLAQRTRWAAAPSVRRVGDGVPRGLDYRARIHALGNAVVPQVIEVVARSMMALKT